jgi:DNA-binding MarR family transcriptional regulator
LSDRERDKVLAKITKPGRERFQALVGESGDDALAQLGSDELGQMVEGLTFAQRAVNGAATRTIKTYSLGPRGPWICTLIAGGVSYPLELAVALKCGRSLVTAELARLTEAGLITATPGKHDRRRSELALTSAGKKAADEVRSEMIRILRRNLAGYSVAELKLFARMLTSVARLEPDEEDGDIC